MNRYQRNLVCSCTIWRQFIFLSCQDFILLNGQEKLMLTFHNRMVRSRPTVKTRSLRRQSIANISLWWPNKLSMWVLSSAFHSLIVLSNDPEKSWDVPCLKVRHETGPLWPWNAWKEYSINQCTKKSCCNNPEYAVPPTAFLWRRIQCKLSKQFSKH